jgi:MtaA/CmuA family methyltransferase
MMFAADLVAAQYRDYATDHRVLVRGQTEVAERFDASVVSAISDPCVEASDLGCECDFPENAPPAVREEKARLVEKSGLIGLQSLPPEDGPRMSNRIRAVAALRQAVGDDLMVEGWVEGPCAEAADLRGLNRLMLDFYDDPSFVADLMDLATEQAIRFADAQVSAGADIVGIGDAASSLIGGALYRSFVLPRTARIVDAIHAAGAAVRLHICGTIIDLLGSIASLPVDQLDVDSMNDMATVRRSVGVALCGNLDPVRVVRDGDPQLIRRALANCRRASGVPYIVGAGCEIPRGTPPEHLSAMAEFAADPEVGESSE